MRKTLAKGGRLKARNDVSQQSDNTRRTVPITNLPIDDSVESKFYRDLASLSAMTNEERAKKDFYNRAHNTGTVAPANEEARTGWMEVNSLTGDVTPHVPTTVSAAPLTEGQRMWRSPAFQLAIAPMFDTPFMLSRINQIKYSPNAFREAIIKDAKQYGKRLNDSWWDYNYENAVKNNDNILIDNLEKERFRIKAPKNKAVDVNKRPQITYHTVSDNFDPNFNIFDTNIEGHPTAIYTTDSPEMSLSYSKSRDLNRMKKLYINLENPVEIDNSGNAWNTISLSRLPQDVYDKIKPADFWGHEYTTRSLEEAQRVLGYDGSIIKNVKDYGSKVENYVPNTVYMINKPSNVKLVGPTLDNNGNLIPLSKRFDFTNPDIRYAIPFTVGLGTAGYLNNSRRNGGKIYNNIKRRISLETL